MAARRRTAPSDRPERPRQGSRAAGAGSSQQKPVKQRPLFYIIAAAVVLFVAGAAAYAGIVPYYSDKIAPGVLIDGMDVSGLTREEAFSALSAYGAQRLNDVSATVNYQGHAWTYGAAELSAGIDIGGAVNAAAAIARSGSLSQRRAEAKSALAGAYALDVAIVLDPEKLEDYLKQIKQELDAKPTEPAMSLQCAGPVYTVPGYNGYQTGLDYSSLFVVTPGSTGIRVDVEATMQLLRDALAQDQTANVDLVVHEQPPAIAEQTLRDSAVLLYHSSSELVGSTDDRDTNIRLALDNFDAMVIAPGQTVSFNETVGERTEERGYFKAKQIGPNGTIVNEVGGGICQAATVLFNAVINAGCEVVERNPHKWPLYFKDYDWGLDAMVNWGTSDLKFTNTTNGYLYLDFYFSYAEGKPKHVNIDIYGMPFEPGVSVAIKSSKVSEYPAPHPRYEYKNPEVARSLNIAAKDWKFDKNLNVMTYIRVASRPGYVFRVQRVWYKDGEEFSREELYTTEYPAIQGVTYTKAAG